MASLPLPQRAARLELLRSALDLFLWVPCFAWYILTRKRHKRAILSDLRGPAAWVESPSIGPLPERPLRIFIAAAEASGEAHAVRLTQALKRLANAAGAPDPEVRGLGGADLAAAGVLTLADPGAQASMGLGATRALPFYVDLIEQSASCWRDWQPDVFAPVDSPALFIPMARTARRYGVPTVHHIAPQFWAWAPWRIGRYKRHVQRALTILPFEPAWHARHGMQANHVGHPLLDTLAELPPAPAFTAEQRQALILLPGSRKHEIDDNLPWMLDVVQGLRSKVPGLVVLLLQSQRCLLYTSPSPRDRTRSRMPSSA